MAPRSYVFSLIFLISATCTGQDGTFTWREGPPAPFDCVYHATVVYQEKVLVAGGQEGHAMAAFDTQKEKWQALPAMPVARAFPAAAVVGPGVYVAGGIDDTHGASSVVERFDIPSSTWHTCAPMSESRSRFSAVAHDGKLYVFGGLDVDPEGTYGNLSSVECYDPATNTWTRRAPMSESRHGHAAVVVGDKILIAGGYTDAGQTDLVEVYDPASDTWAVGSPMPTPRGFLGLVALDGAAYAIAGRVYTGEAPVERYDPGQDTWVTLDPLPERLNRFGCVVVDDRIYILGGEETPRRIRIGIIGD